MYYTWKERQNQLAGLIDDLTNTCKVCVKIFRNDVEFESHVRGDDHREAEKRYFDEQDRRMLASGATRERGSFPRGAADVLAHSSAADGSAVIKEEETGAIENLDVPDAGLDGPTMSKKGARQRTRKASAKTIKAAVEKAIVASPAPRTRGKKMKNQDKSNTAPQAEVGTVAAAAGAFTAPEHNHSGQNTMQPAVTTEKRNYCEVCETQFPDKNKLIRHACTKLPDAHVLTDRCQTRAQIQLAHSASQPHAGSTNDGIAPVVDGQTVDSTVLSPDKLFACDRRGYRAASDQKLRIHLGKKCTTCNLPATAKQVRFEKKKTGVDQVADSKVDLSSSLEPMATRARANHLVFTGSSPKRTSFTPSTEAPPSKMPKTAAEVEAQKNMTKKRESEMRRAMYKEGNTNAFLEFPELTRNSELLLIDFADEAKKELSVVLATGAELWKSLATLRSHLQPTVLEACDKAVRRTKDQSQAKEELKLFYLAAALAEEADFSQIKAVFKDLKAPCVAMALESLKRKNLLAHPLIFSVGQGAHKSYHLYIDSATIPLKSLKDGIVSLTALFFVGNIRFPNKAIDILTFLWTKWNLPALCDVNESVRRVHNYLQ